MKNLITKEELFFKEILNECGYQVDKVTLNPSSRPDLGDYQYNGCMQLASIYKSNPRAIAENIVEKITTHNRYKDINIAGPGFINISFSDEQLIEYANQVNENININYTNDNTKTIYMDYGGANVAKALHVGHLRSANIGEALNRLATALGNKTYSDAHLGDWGRPIGLVMLEIKKTMPDIPYFDDNFQGEYPKISPVTNEDLMKMYPLASQKAKENEEYLEEARKITAQFQEGNKGLMALWEHIMQVSKTDIKRIYDRLSIHFDIWEGESDGNKYVPELKKYLEEKKLLTESQGAQIIDVSKEDDDHQIPPLLFIKSNGSYSYETTDLACIWERMQKYNPDEIWYLVDSRQTLHFEQIFRAARLSKIVNENTKLEFIPFGTMNGKDGKPFKTRDGGVMSLESLLDIAISESEKKILPNITGEERKLIAERVGIAAVKYADFLPNRLTDYNFEPEKFCDLQGKTGPYLLYSTIRMKSLLKKAEEAKITYKQVKKLKNEYDRKILIELLNLNAILQKSMQSKSLNDIAEFLYKITNLYNNFYAQNRILTETDKNIQESWLIITKIIYENNLKLLNILGIEIPDRM